MNYYALLSVSDKTGIVDFAEGLVRAGYTIISSGGTHSVIAAEGIPVTKVSDYTGSPEILNGRVKTLHPKIHGGILAQRDSSSHDLDLKVNRIEHIDIVAVNLYPFKETVSKPDVTFEEAIENIAFTLKLAARGTPFVVETPDGNVLITPVANQQATEVDEALREREKAAMYHQGTPPVPGVGGLPSQTDVANLATDLTRDAFNAI